MAGVVVDKAIMKKPHEKHWISYIKQRIRQNKNFLGFISGQTGSGKSWSTLSICEDVDPEFSIERVVFSGIELMQLINQPDLKRGSAIAFEECGVEMNSRNWASTTNKMLNYLVQTFRHRGLILIMNSPYMDFVDAATRKLFHAEMRTTGIDFKAGECRLKPQLIQYNSRLQKFYYKRLRVIRPEGIVPVDVWRVKKPSPDLIEAYESKKREYTDSLNKRILKELQEAESKRNKRARKELTEIQAEVVGMLKRGLTIPQIAEAKGRGRDVVYKTIDLIKKKGYIITATYGGKKAVRYGVQEPDTPPQERKEEEEQQKHNQKTIKTLKA